MVGAGYVLRSQKWKMAEPQVEFAVWVKFQFIHTKYKIYIERIGIK